ncbi:hypothetical protein Tco_0272859 [Tanacetum coccineum]
MVPRAVLMKSGLVSVNTARQVNAAHTKTTVNAARPMSYLSKKAHSTVKRPIHKNTTFKNSNFNQRVNTVKDKNVNTVRPKAVVNAARPKAVVNVVKGKRQSTNGFTGSRKIDTIVAFGGNPKEGNHRKRIPLKLSSGPNEHVADEAVYKELDDSLVRAATTASSLEAEQDSGNIIKTRSKETPNEASSQGTTSGSGPRRQETIGDTIAQTRFQNVSKLSNDLLLARGNTLQSGEDSLKLKKLMELCANLQTRVLDLETTKTTQANEIDSLKKRVKRLEKKKRSRTYGLKRLYKVGLSARVESSKDKEDLDDADMFDVNTLTGNEVLAEPEVAVKDVNLTVDEVTLAQALAALKSVKPKAKANVVEEPRVPVSAASTKVSAATTTTTATILTPRKGIVITELEEPVKPKKKYLIRLDEEIASKLQAEFDEEERLAWEKDEANVALTEEWDDIQAKVDVDYQLAQRLQAQEQEQFTTEQKATLFKELLEQRRKHFAAKRA